MENPTGPRVRGLLTVTVGKHNAGVLPPQLQSHPLQVTFGCGLLDKLAHLRYITNHKCKFIKKKKCGPAARYITECG